MEGVRSAVDSELEKKVGFLEETLRKFRAEVDLKMTIMEQILKTRNEQFVVQKELLEREQVLYESILVHWANTQQLAASGLSLKFSASGQVDVDDSDDAGCGGEHVEEDKTTNRKRPSCSSTTTTLTRSAKKKRRRMMRVKLKGRDAPPEEESVEQASSDNDDRNDVEEEDDKGDENSDKSVNGEGCGFDKKVFVNFYSADERRKGGRYNKLSSNPIWKHFLREENATSAMCKMCDDRGIQSVLKLSGGSTTALHRHLQLIHNFFIDSQKSVPTASASTGAVEPTGDAPSKSNQETNGGNSSDLVCERPTKSPIWTYFTKFNDSEGLKARCNLCEEEGVSTIYNNSLSSSTSSYHRHLVRNHGLDARKVSRNITPSSCDKLKRHVDSSLETDGGGWEQGMDEGQELDTDGQEHPSLINVISMF